MKKLVPILPFLVVPVLIPLYNILDKFILLDIFGCGCVPETQTNILNIAFNANDLRLTVFLILAVGVSVWSLFLAKRFANRGLRMGYFLSVLVFNLMLASWNFKTFMWL